MTYQSILGRIHWPVPGAPADVAGAFARGRELAQRKKEFAAKQKLQEEALQDARAEQMAEKQRQNELMGRKAALGTATGLLKLSGNPEARARAAGQALPQLRSALGQLLPREAENFPAFLAGASTEELESFAREQRLHVTATSDQKQYQANQRTACQLLANAVGDQSFADPQHGTGHPRFGEFYTRVVEGTPKEIAKARAPQLTVHVGREGEKIPLKEAAMNLIHKTLVNLKKYEGPLQELQKASDDLLTFWAEGKDTLYETAERLGFKTRAGIEFQERRQELQTLSLKTVAGLLYGESGKQLSDFEINWLLKGYPNMDKMSGTKFRAAARRLRQMHETVSGRLLSLAEGFTVPISRTPEGDEKIAEFFADHPELIPEAEGVGALTNEEINRRLGEGG